MTGVVHFESFLAAAVLLTLTPGNDTIFILSKSIAQGRRAGIVSALGIGLGCAFHTMLAAFGLSVVIAESMMIFNALKFAGAAYIFFVAYKMMRNKAGLPGAMASGSGPGAPSGYRDLFRDAFLTNALNPKVAIFFLAFIPQFVAPEARGSSVPFLILGGTFLTTGTLWCIVLALFSSHISSKLKNNDRAAETINKVCGAALVALGIRVALTEMTL
jgi:threonine/homoserine/homoserine lactone efflux protein